MEDAVVINYRNTIQKKRRFMVFDRAIAKARREIMAQEDADIFKEYPEDVDWLKSFIARKFPKFTSKLDKIIVFS